MCEINSDLTGQLCGLWSQMRKQLEVLTLDNMGDHQRRTGVITSQTSGGNVLFDLESKQVPAHKHKPFSLSQQRSFPLQWQKRRVCILHKTTEKFLQVSHPLNQAMMSSENPFNEGNHEGNPGDQLRVVQQTLSAGQCSHAQNKKCIFGF